MRQKGYNVTIITSHNSARKVEFLDNGVKVIWLCVNYDNTFSYFKRIFSFLSFILKSTIELYNQKNTDFIYATSTPLTVGVIALIGKLKGIPFIFEVRDLWPEVPIQMGIINNKLLQFCLYYFEKLVYDSANGIVVLSPPMYEYVKIKTKTPLICVPNMSDFSLFSEDSDVEKNATTFSILYAGAISLANDLQSLLFYYEQLSNELKKTVEIHICGKGKNEKDIHDLIKNSNGKILYHGYLSKYQLNFLMQKMDACYISYSSYPILNTGSPNKFFDSLAAHKICILNFDGWIAELINKHKCGFVIHDFKEFEKMIISVLSNNELKNRMKNNSGILAEEFNKDVQCNKLLNWMKELFKVDD